MEKLPPGFLSLGSPSEEFSFPNLLNPPRDPPPLLDEIIEEIFLRTPLDEPERLIRASLACKRWARLICSHSFRRRYRERHRRPLLLGFIGNFIDTSGFACFIPTPRFLPAHPIRCGYRAHDARHGRVLLNRTTRCGNVFQGVEAALIVWDPITDDQWPLPPLLRDQQVHNWHATVLCAPDPVAITTLGACDHLGCRPGCFLVVFVGIAATEMFVSVYSSESSAWSEVTSAELPAVGDDHLDEWVAGALVGNALYFVFQMGTRMLKYDLATRMMSLMPLPISPILRRVVPMAMDGGSCLGLAELNLQSDLILRSMDIDPNGNEGEWKVSRKIELSTLLPEHAAALFAVAAADEVDAVFLYTIDGLYTFDLKSGECTKVFSYGFYDIAPYVSFYTPALRAALIAEEPNADA